MSQRSRGVVLTRQGWQKLQDAIRESETQKNSGDRYTFEELSERTGLGLSTVTKVLEREEGVDKRTLDRLFGAFNLDLDKSDYSKLETDFKRTEGVIANRRQNWGEAVDVSVFYGRTEELTTLGQWILKDDCRLIALLGMGGIGKTYLSVRLAEQIKAHFDYVIWRSLRSAPVVEDILADFIKFLSDEQETEIPANVGTISRLIDCLRSSRCLLVLDNVEAILQSGDSAGHYREGYEEYGELLRLVGEANHQSCLIVTSRENPKELALLEGETSPVRALKLTGLKSLEAQQIFKVKSLIGSEDEWRVLIERYAGNPLALKVVSTTIRELFIGNISEFLKQGIAIFGDVRVLLDQQFHRLSDLEKEIVYWLAIAREPVSILELREDVIPPVSQPKLVEALESLERRLLIEKCTTRFTLQPVIMEYVTDRLIESVCQEISEQQIGLFRSHALIKAQAKDYVKKHQACLIFKPITDNLIAIFRSKINLKNRLIKILLRSQIKSTLELGYIGGNVLNLLGHLKTDLSGHDFSYLTIWQADLRNVKLHHVNFAHSDLAKSIFAETIIAIFSVTLSPDGKLLATGDASGVLCLWQVADGKLLLSWRELSGWIRSLAFSPDGSILVCTSADHTVKLYDVSNGQSLRICRGHSAPVGSVAFNPDGHVLASGGDDKTVRVWDTNTGVCLRTLQGHENAVRAVAFSPDGTLLASGSDDRTVRLWDVATGQCRDILRGHTRGVWAIAISPDGRVLASGSDDQTVGLWDVGTGQCLHTLRSHTEGVHSIAFCPQGNTLASGSADQTVRLWDVGTGQCRETLYGHTGVVLAVRFSPDGQTLASGSSDDTIRWDLHTGKCLQTLRSTRPYEGMNITGVTGLTEATIATLKALGAVES